jgi:hypothetical protein
MTVRQQLDALWRQFPASQDLAVSLEMYDAFLAELAPLVRFESEPQSWGWVWPPPERYRTFTAQRHPLRYRDRRLVVVESVRG